MNFDEQHMDHYRAISMPNNVNPYDNMNMMIPTSSSSKPHIRKFMRDFNDKTKEKFNPHWFERSNEALIDGMKDIIMSCERRELDRYFVLKVLEFETILDYEEINRILCNYYSVKTKNNKRIDNDYDYINLKDSDVMLLRVRYYVKLNIPNSKIKIDKRTGEPERTEGEIDTYIVLPRYVNKYYFRIYGNYYNPIFQIVDGSTYNNTTSNSSNRKLQITLKTQMMPIVLYREIYNIVDEPSKVSKKCTLFASYIFSKKTDAMKFILSRYGFYGALEFLEIQGIYVQDAKIGKILDPVKFYNFYDLSNTVLVSVYKLLFNRDLVTQSFVYTILKNSSKLKTFDEIFDPRYWVRNLGSSFQSDTLEKGIRVNDSFEIIYDIPTREFIHLPKLDKDDTYLILRWMMREFNILIKRDNSDLSTKHPRMADWYLPQIYAMKISKNLYRICDKGKNITFDDVIKAIDIMPNYILKNFASAKLVNYVDLVNDNDAELALSYTYKGISGIGDSGMKDKKEYGQQGSSTPGGSRVPRAYRSVHPSHLGRVDIDSSSNSDPGLSGIICPMAKVYDESFTEYQEPNGWRDLYKEALDDLHRMYRMIEIINTSKRVGLSYDYVKEQLVKETIESYHKIIPNLMNEDLEEDDDDDESESEDIEEIIITEDMIPDILEDR